MSPEPTMPRLAEDNHLPTGKILCLLAAYFLLHIAVRIATSDSLELDEAEQLVLGQALSWGYGTKPPLYSWLQLGFFQIFGERVLALSTLKNLLLFCTYLCTFLAARRLAGRGAYQNCPGYHHGPVKNCGPAPPLRLRAGRAASPRRRLPCITVPSKGGCVCRSLRARRLPPSSPCDR